MTAKRLAPSSCPWQIVYGGVTVTIEYSLTDAGGIALERDFCQISAVLESPVFYAGDALWNCDAGQSVTGLERRATYTCDAIAQTDIGQAIAALEC